MSLAFIGFTTLSLLFRYSAYDAEKRFHRTLKQTLPRYLPPYPRARWKKAFLFLREELPHRLLKARTLLRVEWGRRFLFNSLACLSLLIGLWRTPPSFLTGNDLVLLQQAGTAVVALAFLFDTLELLELVRLTSKIRATSLPRGDTY